MLFMRRKVPASMPDVSANASFCPTFQSVGHWNKKDFQTHHLGKLDGRVANLVPNTDGELSKIVITIEARRSEDEDEGAPL
jgi:hypothetical protein